MASRGSPTEKSKKPTFLATPVMRKLFNKKAGEKESVSEEKKEQKIKPWITKNITDIKQCCVSAVTGALAKSKIRPIVPRETKSVKKEVVGRKRPRQIASHEYKMTTTDSTNTTKCSTVTKPEKRETYSAVGGAIRKSKIRPMDVELREAKKEVVGKKRPRQIASYEHKITTTDSTNATKCSTITKPEKDETCSPVAGALAKSNIRSIDIVPRENKSVKNEVVVKKRLSQISSLEDNITITDFTNTTKCSTVIKTEKDESCSTEEPTASSFEDNTTTKNSTNTTKCSTVTKTEKDESCSIQEPTVDIFDKIITVTATSNVTEKELGDFCEELKEFEIIDNYYDKRSDSLTSIESISFIDVSITQEEDEFQIVGFQEL